MTIGAIVAEYVGMRELEGVAVEEAATGAGVPDADSSGSAPGDRVGSMVGIHGAWLPLCDAATVALGVPVDDSPGVRVALNR